MMDENDNFNMENQQPAAPLTDDIDAARKKGQALFASVCEHPELTTLLYDNLLDIKKGDLRDAIALALSGDEKGLLDLLDRQAAAPAAGSGSPLPRCRRTKKKADQQ